MAGGVGDDKEHDGLNRATQSELQSGSAIKPLTIYAPGFQQGTISPATVIKDLPISYEDDDAWPKNDNRTYSYTHTIYSGITSSVNAVAANTLKLIGDSYSFNFGKDDFGLSTLVDPDDLNFASLAMGAQHHGVTVRDMTCAFATFANNGVYREGQTFTKVYDSKGNLVLDNTQDARTILSEKVVTYTNYCLVNAANNGTGGGAIFSGMQIAGKTGTTSSSRDRWFCGYTGHYTAAVWCGYDTPETINLSYNPASQLWRKVMQPVHKGLKNISLYSTRKLSPVSVCLESGKIATEACKNDIRGDRTTEVMVYPEDRPQDTCTAHVQMEICSNGGVANEYCKHFMDAGTDVKVEVKALVKITPSEFEKIREAMEHGLDEMFYRDDYVYLLNPSGGDGIFNGFKEDINSDVLAPYMICTEHTAISWAEYQAGQVVDPTTPSTPATPTTPTTPTIPTTPTTPSTGTVNPWNQVRR